MVTTTTTLKKKQHGGTTHSMLFVVLSSTFLVFIWIMNLSLLDDNDDHNTILPGSASTTQQQQQRRDQQQVHPQQQQQQQQKNNDDDDMKFHLVFSTGCNAFQDWQSYALFFHIWKSGQSGNVTRVASGCTPEEAEVLQQVFQEQIVNSIPTAKDRFHLHLTPDYSRIHHQQQTTTTTNKKQQQKQQAAASYKFFNKPWGLKHWMEHELGYSTTDAPSDADNTIIIILDPDQFVMRPFSVTYNSTTDPYIQWHGQNTDWLLTKRQQQKKSTDPFYFQIRKGYPYGQLYGLGGSWVDQLNFNISMIIQAASKVSLPKVSQQPTVSATHNHLLAKNDWWSKTAAERYYAAGPPYLAVASDMYAIVATWASVAVPVYRLTNQHFLAEMYAYGTAAAYLNLPHQLATSYMVSNVLMKTGEGWKPVDDANHKDKDNTAFLELSNPNYQRNLQHPHVLHFCQRFYLGPYFFSKYKVPKDILSCDHPLFLEPPLLLNEADKNLEIANDTHNNHRSQCGSIASRYNSSITPNGKKYQIGPQEAKRQAFVLCHVIARLNDAVEFWKQQHCPPTSEISTSTTNYRKVYVFPKDKA